MSETTSSAALPADTVTLESGATMPLLGFGTWQIRGADATNAVSVALESGYRHLDTATVYGNEGEVGRGLRESDVSRSDVFVTTKFPPNRAGNESDVLRESLELLGIDHLDLWLIHWPADGSQTDIWRELVRARESGAVHDVGVSNFSLEMIDEITSATGVRPSVNQIEWSPLLFDRDVLEGHRERGVAVEGYSALRGGTLDHPAISAIADRLGRTTAQVIIRWHLQHRVIVIPKSQNAERIRSNAEVFGFELSGEDMAALDGLGAHP